MAPHQAPHPVDVGVVQGVQGGKRPHQLQGVGERERPDGAEGHRSLGVVGKAEAKAGGDEQPACPGGGDPGGQQGGQVPIREVAVEVVRQVVLELSRTTSRGTSART